MTQPDNMRAAWCNLHITPSLLVQVFYNEFGRLMMHQPVIGSDFTTYAPIFLVPYVVLLTCNIFNRTGDLSVVPEASLVLQTATHPACTCL